MDIFRDKDAIQSIKEDEPDVVQMQYKSGAPAMPPVKPV